MSETSDTFQQSSDTALKEKDLKYGTKCVVLGLLFKPVFSSPAKEIEQEQEIESDDMKDDNQQNDTDTDMENEQEYELFIKEIYQNRSLSQWFSGHQDLSKMDVSMLSYIYSKINFTYRTRFSPIERAVDGPSPISLQLMFRENPLNVLENALTNPDCFNTDIGWGCMIRTGQSLLANAIQRIQLGKDFRLTQKYNDKYVVSLFRDTPNAPFSLHNFVQTGVNLSNMKPGQWFGPSATSRSIQKLIQEYPQSGIDNCIVSVASGDIPKEKIDLIYTQKSNAKILILLGIKLGVNSVNELYWKDILEFFGRSFCVGIAGGRPSSSLYFFGYEQQDEDNIKESKLLYFDPHTSQPSLNDDDYETCHSMNYGKLPLKDMDPSMLVGMLLESNDDWLKLQNFANTTNMFNIISSNVENLNFDESNLDIESLESEETQVGKGEDITDLPKERGCILNTQSIFDTEASNDDEGDDEDLEIIQSRRGNMPCIANDYIDVGSLAYHTPDSLEETFESIQCKKQKIMIFDQDRSFEKMKDGEIEVEKVLVESDSMEPSTLV